MIALPDVLAVMSRPSRIGTPDAISVDSVRQNRATAILRMIGPRIGIFSMIGVDDAPALLGRVVRAERPAHREHADDDERHEPDQVVAERDDDARRQRQLGAEAGEQAAKVGMTFHRITPMTTQAMTMTAIG